MDDSEKKPRVSTATTPMFESIMAPMAAKMKGKLCRVKPLRGDSSQFLRCIKEDKFGYGMGPENLVARDLAVGTMVMAVGIGTVPTDVRVLLAQDNHLIDGIYHVSVLNLELLNPEEEDTEEGEDEPT